MKILILANSDMGLFKFRFELLEKLAINNEVLFCVPTGDFVPQIVKLGCAFIPCNVLERRSTNPIKDVRLLSYYKKIILKNKPEIVLTYTIKPNVYGGIICQLMKVHYLTNVTGLGTTIENGGLLANVSMFLYKLGLRKSNCVFFQNKSNQHLLMSKGIIKGKTRLIPGSGVNLRKHCFEPYPSDHEKIHFLFVGRLMRDKGIEELLDAFHAIHKENDKTILDIVGWCDEDYSESLRKAVDAGEAIYYGMQNDVHPFYTRCHCAILPSYHEGTANVLLEASATGRPVIATRVPGCQETFEEGVTGYGCDAKSINSLKEAMSCFLATPQEKREQMGKLARKKMEKEFDRNIVVRAYFEEIMQVSEILYKEQK